MKKKRMLWRITARNAAYFAVAWVAIAGEGWLRIVAIIAVVFIILLRPIFATDAWIGGRIVLHALHAGRFLGEAFSEIWKLSKEEFSFRERIWIAGTIVSVVISVSLYERRARDQNLVFWSVAAIAAAMFWGGMLYAAIARRRKKC